MIEKIICNKIRCDLCQDVIESKYRHHFIYCKCGNIAADGGKEYLKRVGLGISNKTWTDLSLVIEEE